MNALRPLSIGEILDRGFVLFVRTLSRTIRLLIPAVAAGCAGLGTYFLAPVSFRPEVAEVATLVAFVAGLPALGAVIYMFGCESDGMPCTVRDAYRFGAPRFRSIVLVEFYACLISIVVVGVPLVASYFIALSWRWTGSGSGSVALAVVFGIPMLLALTALYGYLQTMFWVALSVCSFERRTARAAYGIAFARCRLGKQKWRAVLTGLAILTPNAATLLAVVTLHASLRASPVTIAATALTIGSHVLQIVLQVASALLSLGWGTAFSRDARVRVEGLDLRVLAEPERLAELA